MGGGREKERERNIDLLLLARPQLGASQQGTSHNPGMCPDWRSNQQPFGLVHRLVLNPLSHTVHSWGFKITPSTAGVFKKYLYF